MLKENTTNSCEYDHALIYHYWSDKSVPAWKDITCPVVLAASTARKNHPNLKIYILDTNIDSDWDNYPDLLNLTIVPWETHKFDEKKLPHGRFENFAPKTLSRVFDIHNFSKTVPESNIIFSDSDIFWIKPIFPLDYMKCINKFCGSTNSGLFYFKKNSNESNHFFNIWKSMILIGLTDDKIKDEILKFNSHKRFMCESVLKYIIQFSCGSFQHIDIKENFVFNKRNFFLFNESIKNLHLMHGKWGDSRGAACKKFKEIYENLALSKENIDRIIPKNYDQVEIRNIDVEKLYEL